MPRAAWLLLVGALVFAGLAAALASNWAGLAGHWNSLLQALWLLPGLVGLHLTQLLLSAFGWRALFSGHGPGIGTFHKLRIVREGIDSLLPVAQVGGEIVGARLLSQRGVPPSQAGASVVVDVTIELLMQVVFLVAGLCALTWLSPSGIWRAWGDGAADWGGRGGGTAAGSELRAGRGGSGSAGRAGAGVVAGQAHP